MTEHIARSIYRAKQPQTDGDPVPPITYGPDFYADSNMFERRRDWLFSHGLKADHSVLVVGCGYGALNDALIDAGVSEVYGLEPGSWIWDGLHLETDRIGNDWIGSGTAEAVLANLGAPEKFDYVIDEDAAVFHQNSELPAFITGLEALANTFSRIVHVVSALIIEQGPRDSSLNSKTLDQWRLVAPHHTWESAINIQRF